MEGESQEGESQGEPLVYVGFWRLSLRTWGVVCVSEPAWQVLGSQVEVAPLCVSEPLVCRLLAPLGVVCVLEPLVYRLLAPLSAYLGCGLRVGTGQASMRVPS